MGENTLTEAIYTPKSLNFVVGYAMKAISHELTAAGAPREVTFVEGGGIPFSIRFKDNESIGMPVFRDKEVNTLRLFMVDANGWTTLKDPAYYDLYTAAGARYRFNAYKASPLYMQLVSHRTVTGREETYQDMGVEIIRDANQTLRQVLLPTRLADIVATNSTGYAVKFYSLTRLSGGKDTNGCYRLAADATPFESWTFANPEPGTLRKLHVTRLMGSRTTLYDYTYTSDSDSWSLQIGDGKTGAKQDVKTTIWNDSRTERWLTRELKGADGRIASRTVEKIKTFSWGDGVLQRITDPAGANLTNTFTYNAAGLTESEVRPDGSWHFYRYDSAGRVTNELSAINDAPRTSLVSAAHALLTSYTPVDPADTPRLNDQTPRTVTETILGTVVARTYTAFRQGSQGELVQINEIAATPSSAYGAAGNLRTVTTSYGTNTSSHQIGRTKTISYPDGRLDTYTYELGVYQPGTETTPPSFVAAANGPYWCETIIHGTTNAPAGVAGQTTKTTRILDAMSQELLREQWVCTGPATYARLTWVEKSFDEWQHPVVTTSSSGAKTEASWGGNCCGKVWESDKTGVQTDFIYDSLGRLEMSVKIGHPATGQPDLYTSYVYDSANHQVSQSTFATGLRLTTSNSYDLAGRLIASLDPKGIATRYLYQGAARTQIRAGLTNTTIRYADGQTKCTLQNGVIQSWNDYGVNADGTKWSQAFTGPLGTNSPVWTRQYTDALDRTVRTEKPGYGGAILTNASFYNSLGQLIRSTSTGAPDTLYEYNDLGEQFRSGTDVNNNGRLDLAGPDRVSETYTGFETDAAGALWQVSASILYADDNSATPTTNAIQKTRLTGLGTNEERGTKNQEQLSQDLLGNQTISRTYVNRDAKTVTQTTRYPDSTNAAISVAINGLAQYTISKTGVCTTNAYDALGRQILIATGVRQDALPSARQIAQRTHYNSLGQVDYTEDALSNRTTYTYDALTGRRTAVTDALSNTTYTAYDPEGHVIATWGATYPVAYEFDPYGRMVAMYTYRGSNTIDSLSSIFNLKSSMDRTTWSYDPATGLLTNKLYADGKGPSYTYTPAGQLATRTWARGVTSSYAYSPCCGALTSINYSDGTPSVSFTLDRLGRQKTITDATGTRTFTYNDALQLAAEAVPVAAGAPPAILTRTYDSLGRPTGFTLGSDYAVTYGYTPDGRLGSLSATTSHLTPTTWNYAYIPGTDLLAGWSNNAGFAALRTFEPHRDLIAKVANTFHGQPIGSFAYANDALARRVSRMDTGRAGPLDPPHTNLFAYNARSELSSAQMGTNAYGYAYDPIGNRLAASNNAEAFTYAANALNQYTNIISFAFSAPPRETIPLFDADGNLTNDGRFAYVWDAENRLIAAQALNQEPGTTNRLTFVYDYMSRRVAKTSDGISRKFLYDGWNLIAETISNQQSTITNSYVWGLDLSGSLQDAGGIGGLLCASLTKHEEPGTKNLVFYFYDANGNVSDLTDANGNSLAHYEFDPYGNTIVAFGTQAAANPFRFSTKYTDDETWLVYYGYRFYSPMLGRWLSRDPLNDRTFALLRFEKSLPNILRNRHIGAMLIGSVVEIVPEPDYLFANNTSITRYDILGLSCGHPPWADNCQCASSSGRGTRQSRSREPEDSDGCSVPEDLRGLLPGDKDNPTGRCSFLSCCDDHDCQYQICNFGRSDADSNFLDCMLDSCSACGGSTLDTLICRIWAYIYYLAVRAGGSSIYDESQQELCESCCCD
jgi:RHS repeat-associated protein